MTAEAGSPIGTFGDDRRQRTEDRGQRTEKGKNRSKSKNKNIGKGKYKIPDRGIRE